MKEFKIPQKFYEGDLCIAKGYGNRVWSVVGYTKEQSVLYGKYDESMLYNLICVVTLEHIIAEQDDMTLVCRAAYSYDYIRQLDQQGRPPKKPVNKAGKEKPKMKTTKLTRKQKDELLNELLDRYIDVQRFIKADGGITEQYQKQLDEIEAELSRINQLPTTR